jgi:hypothetical protein
LVGDPADHAVEIRDLSERDDREGQKSCGAGHCDDPEP